jgi:D-beta-D-heptose 7-phosphate kinase/D-beta-D-heptose 1-phosphate adenosyltransferase
MTELAAEYRLAGKTTVFANGCFDLLHVGHVTALQQAAVLGDVLIVAVNSDASVRRLKGEGRPVIGEDERAALIAALECVDHVLIFEDDTPHRLLEQIRPNVLVKGGTTDDIVGREVVEAYGGCALHVSKSRGVSTTSIVVQIQTRSRASPPCEIGSLPSPHYSLPDAKSPHFEPGSRCPEISPEDLSADSNVAVQQDL